MLIALCAGSLPYTLGSETGETTPRYNEGVPQEGRLPPAWAPVDEQQAITLNKLIDAETLAAISAEHGIDTDDLVSLTQGPAAEDMRTYWQRTPLGTDELGRSLMVRCMLGGAISLGIGLAAAGLSVLIGTTYGLIAGYAGGKVDSIMMRIVDVIYGLPYILLVVLLAVAGDALISNWISRSAEREQWIAGRTVEVMAGAESTGATDPAAWATNNPDAAAAIFAEAAEAVPPRSLSPGQRNAIDIGILLIAIGGVSWLTMARVIRGQVLSLKNQPFVEAARAIGVPLHLTVLRHLLPNLLGTIIVYTTLTVPQAILQESFLSFLGIGVKPPLPSWGNLAAEGLDQVNPYRSDWWLVVFPSLLLGVTLLALNFVGEGLREAFDPKSRGRA